jgi:hypothetical protein
MGRPEMCGVGAFYAPSSPIVKRHSGHGGRGSSVTTRRRTKSPSSGLRSPGWGWLAVRGPSGKARYVWSTPPARGSGAAPPHRPPQHPLIIMALQAFVWGARSKGAWRPTGSHGCAPRPSPGLASTGVTMASFGPLRGRNFDEFEHLIFRTAIGVSPLISSLPVAGGQHMSAS